MEFAGAHVEVGGTLIHSSNRRLGDLLAATGLERTTPDLSVDGQAETIAVWEGSSFVFSAKTTSAGMALALVRRYGIRDLVRLRTQTVRTKNAFTRIYELQDAGRLSRLLE